jgi:UDP-N-acetylglucosamine diphosphorylase/glucosamine-1-phosphate N-acetyltransferase
MNHFFLSDRETTANLFPFTLTRSAADIRIGILTIREKWKMLLGFDVHVLSTDDIIPPSASLLSAAIVPTSDFIDSSLRDGMLAEEPDWSSVKILQHPWHIFQLNDWAIRQDFRLVTKGRKSQDIPKNVLVTGQQNIFIEDGARLSHCFINAENGPVYIGRNSEIMEGASIRGPFALLEGGVVKMGARIYGATTVGPYSVAGGEIKNSMISGFSNKAHDGYLGDSVIGEWCNLGAGTSNSNVKNNASEVRIYNPTQREFVNTGLYKCGVIMGDYSRASINTSFNTGTVIGVCANIFGEGLTPKFIPSFAWGSNGTIRYSLDKAIEDIAKWKKLKGHELGADEKIRLQLIFDQNN